MTDTRVWSAETRRARSEKMQRQWQDPAFRAAALARARSKEQADHLRRLTAKRHARNRQTALYRLGLAHAQQGVPIHA